MHHLSNLIWIQAGACEKVASHLGCQFFSSDSLVSSNTYNWLVTEWTKYGRKKWQIKIFLIQVNLDMTDHCTTDFCIWRTICLVPVRCISSIRHMYTTDFAYDGPIFLVPLSPSYPSSPVLNLNSSYYQLVIEFQVYVYTLFTVKTYLCSKILRWYAGHFALEMFPVGALLTYYHFICIIFIWFTFFTLFDHIFFPSLFLLSNSFPTIFCLPPG